MFSVCYDSDPSHHNPPPNFTSISSAPFTSKSTPLHHSPPLHFTASLYMCPQPLLHITVCPLTSQSSLHIKAPLTIKSSSFHSSPPFSPLLIAALLPYITAPHSLYSSPLHQCPQSLLHITVSSLTSCQSPSYNQVPFLSQFPPCITVPFSLQPFPLTSQPPLTSNSALHFTAPFTSNIPFQSHPPLYSFTLHRSQRVGGVTGLDRGWSWCVNCCFDCPTS